MATDPKSIPGGGIVNQAAQRGRRAPNAALDTTTKSYTVVGPHRVGGVATGGTVVLTLTAGQAHDMIESGHIKLAP